MAISGIAVGNQSEITPEVLDRFYAQDDMHGLAEQFADVAKAGLSESVDIFGEPSKFFMTPSLKNQMKNFFINETYDAADPKFADPRAIREHMEDYGRLFDNDLKGLMESAPLGAFNPVVGLTFPMHKNLLMTTVFDKGAIPKDVAAGPQFTLTMETRTLFSPDGREIDMFLEQNKIKDIVEASVPKKDIILPLPEDQQTNVLKLLGVTTNTTTANISTATRVSAIIIKDVYLTAGALYFDKTDAANPIKTVAEGSEGIYQAVINIKPIHFKASYGQYDRTFQERIDLRVADSASTVRDEIFQFAGSMHKNRFTFMASSANVVAVILSASLDTSSAMYETPKVKWSARTDFFQIPDAPHITVTISPEETRDIQAMYNVNQLTKLLSMIKLTLVNYKDDKILEKLDESFENLPAHNKLAAGYNAIPDDSYMGSYVAWRYETFMDFLDTQVTYLLQILNDENMTCTIFGRPELIRKLTPKEYNYTTPPSIGPVMLDYKKSVKTSDNRVYEFISSNKLRNDNNLILILNPRNSSRVMYKIFDYQMYIGNEIRDVENYTLPAVTAFERWLMIEYQAVQARIQIFNPSGRKEDIENTTPINPNRALNDYTANRVTYRSDGKGGNVQYLDYPEYMLGTARSAINPAKISPGETRYPKQNAEYAYTPPNYAVSDPGKDWPPASTT